MSTTTEQSSLTNEPALELSPVLSARYALKWRHLAVCSLFCVFFMYLNYVPLFFSDIWGHVHYGRWALQHGGFPQEDPFMPLAAGMHSANNAWLAQLVFALVEAWGGAQFLSNLFAITVLATYLVYCRAFFELTRRLSLALVGTGMVLFVGWSRHAIIRPEIFGGLCFALLVWMLLQGEPWRSRRPRPDADSTSDRLPLAVWLGVPVMFALWANLHGSFMTGLVVLGCHAVGRVIEIAWRSRSFSAVLADPWVRRWTLLTELALAATLLNPAGIDLLIETLRFGQNPNLRDVVEWYPLRATAAEGVQFGITIVAMLVLLRHSRVRMTPVDVLLLLVFGIAVGPTIRMIGWWAPVFALVMLPHIAAVARRIAPRVKRECHGLARTLRLPSLADRSGEPASASSMATNIADTENPRSDTSRRPTTTDKSVAPKHNVEEQLTPAHFLPSLICLLVIWAAFALTPISENLLGGKPRNPDQIHAQGTPLQAAAWLRENPPETMVFGPQWWSDWLCWDGPPGMQTFTTTQIHLMPRRAWRDYMRVARGEGGWSETLDRYGVKTLVIDKEWQRGFALAARRSTDWRPVYEDDRAMILKRVEAASNRKSQSESKGAADSDVAAHAPPADAAAGH